MPATAVDDGPLRLRLPGFEGTLAELAHQLRTQRLAPAEVDLLLVVRERRCRLHQLGPFQPIEVEASEGRLGGEPEPAA